MLRIPSNCTGCQACVSICPRNCISMSASSEEFLYPIIDATMCINCNQCDKVCPVLHTQEKSPYTEAFAVKCKTEDKRMHSTSGGVFPLLAGQILEQNGIIFGAVYDENFMAKHISGFDRSNLASFQSAKYVQSAIGSSFIKVEKALKVGTQVLFSGTPCQCEGLKTFLGREYSNLLLVDLICHGVPSPKVWQAYVDYRSKKENNGIRPKRINMRSKASGWSRYGYSTEFDYGDGFVTRTLNSQDLYMKAFVGNICLRKSCSNCVAKGIQRCTDITLGDYWGIWDQHPEFDDDKGTSVVFVHSQKGREMLKQLRDNIDCLEVDIEDAYRENSSMVHSAPAHSGRDEFLAQITADNFEELIDKYFKLETRRVATWPMIKSRLRKIINIFR